MASVDPAKQAAALAGELDRHGRRITTLENRAGDIEGVVQSLATDVATLAAYVAPDGAKKRRPWLWASAPKLPLEDLEAVAHGLGAVWLPYPDACLPPACPGSP